MDGQVSKVELVALSVQVIHAVPVILGEVCAGQQRALGNGFDGDVSACPEHGILPCPGFYGTVHNGHCHAHACAHSAGGSESHRAETCVQLVFGPDSNAASAGHRSVCADECPGKGRTYHISEFLVDRKGLICVGIAVAHRGDGETRAGLASGHGAIRILVHRVIFVEVFAHILVCTVVLAVHRHVAVVVATAGQGLVEPIFIVLAINISRFRRRFFLHAG